MCSFKRKNPSYRLYVYHTLYSTLCAKSVVKNPPDNAGDTKDMDSIPGSGRAPGVGNGNSLQILAWENPWIEEPGRLQSKGSQRIGHS